LAKQIITLYHAAQKPITKDQHALGTLSINISHILSNRTWLFANRIKARDFSQTGVSPPSDEEGVVDEIGAMGVVVDACDKGDESGEGDEGSSKPDIDAKDGLSSAISLCTTRVSSMTDLPKN
jgi:hypothetical protein